MTEEQYLTNNNAPPNPDWAILKQHFGQCFDKNGVFLLEKFAANLAEQAVDFSTESYGLEWLGKSYARLLASDAATTLLKADEDHNAQSDHALADNILIQGDNLEALKHLAHAYYEKVKMIYIDPPYNTGGDDFVYADDRKFTVNELQTLMGVDRPQAERILKFTQSKSNTHSAWLTFMYPRLYLAKRLLRDDGVIFVSIDDNEVAQLRLLMDEVFGEENFVAIFPWRKRSAKSDVPYGVSQDYEWIVSYCKSNFNAALDTVRKYYSTEDYPNDKWRLSDLTTQKIESERPNSAFDLVDPKTNKVYKYNPKRLWGITKETFDEYYLKGKIVFPDDYDFLNISIPSYRVFESEDKTKALKKYNSEDAKKAVSTFLPKEIGMNENGNKEIFNLFQKKVFSYPKPTTLLKHLLNSIYESDCIILDFFAGSGTTGDAVMQLNAEDGGNRQFILVQLPEAIDPKKKKDAYDFVKNTLQQPEPTIFHITKERLTRAAAKIKTELEEKIAKLGEELASEETQAQIEQYKKRKTQMGFKVFETLPIWDDYDFEADTQDADAVLFNVSSLTEGDIQTLLTTWKTADGMALTHPLKTVDLGGYVAYCGQASSSKLYLMHSGFRTEHLKTLLEKLDTDASFQFNSLIAFGHNFDSKTLRELADNLKSYKNKKSSDIEFITRY